MNFWKNKNVFVTGHTGFKGSWLCTQLLDLGAKVSGYALPPDTQPNLFEGLGLQNKMNSQFGDVADLEKLSKTLNTLQPEIVFHLAAQPLVRRSYREPVSTYLTNVMGTVHLLEACRFTQSVKTIVVITTDKCYENKEWEWPYREIDTLGGSDPYANSKACAELVCSSYRQSFFSLKNKNSRFVGLSTVRAGNVIGGGDWSEDRLIPDAVRSIADAKKLEIRSPQSIRPWQHVLEPLSGYIKVAQKLYEQPASFSEAFNFGPNEADCINVETVLEKFKSNWSNLAWINTGAPHELHESKILKLDSSKANHQLNWAQKWNIDRAIEKTTEWYKTYYKNPNSAWELTLKQIREYDGCEIKGK